jgi:hypothetical protein
MKKVVFAMIAVLAMSVAAHANTLVLTEVVGNLYQQTVQSPCIFSNPSCSQPAGWQDTALPTGGAITSYNALSPVYQGSTLLAVLAGGSMILGIDINQASGQPAQTLQLFEMLVNGIVVDTYPGPTNVPAGNNGNGYADYILTNFSSFAPNSTVQFHFVFNNANDGTENVFLIAGPPTSVPEPSTVMTVGFGLLLLGFAGRKIASFYPARF